MLVTISKQPNGANLEASAYINDRISKRCPIEAKKPIVIFGESFFKVKSANYLFNLSKEFLNKNDK